MLFICFIRRDGDFVVGFIFVNSVFGVYADVVGGGRVDINDGGRV